MLSSGSMTFYILSISEVEKKISEEELWLTATLSISTQPTDYISSMTTFLRKEMLDQYVICDSYYNRTGNN